MRIYMKFCYNQLNALSVRALEVTDNKTWCSKVISQLGTTFLPPVNMFWKHIFALGWSYIDAADIWHIRIGDKAARNSQNSSEKNQCHLIWTWMSSKYCWWLMSGIDQLVFEPAQWQTFLKLYLNHIVILPFCILRPPWQIAFQVLMLPHKSVKATSWISSILSHATAADGIVATTGLCIITKTSATSVDWRWLWPMTRFEYEVRIYCQSRTNSKVVKWG